MIPEGPRSLITRFVTTSDRPAGLSCLLPSIWFGLCFRLPLTLPSALQSVPYGYVSLTHADWQLATGNGTHDHPTARWYTTFPRGARSISRPIKPRREIPPQNALNLHKLAPTLSGFADPRGLDGRSGSGRSHPNKATSWKTRGGKRGHHWPVDNGEKTGEVSQSPPRSQ
jgi:hypothetical protein